MAAGVEEFNELADAQSEVFPCLDTLESLGIQKFEYVVVGPTARQLHGLERGWDVEVVVDPRRLAVITYAATEAPNQPGWHPTIDHQRGMLICDGMGPLEYTDEYGPKHCDILLMPPPSSEPYHGLFENVVVDSDPMGSVQVLRADCLQRWEDATKPSETSK